MSQRYEDNETGKKFNLFFEGFTEAEVKSQMKDTEDKLKDLATLLYEGTGMSLDEVKKELKNQIIQEYKEIKRGGE